MPATKETQGAPAKAEPERWSPGLASVPSAACRLTVGQFELGDNGADAKTAPVRILARTGEPVYHWFWGKVAHDLAGMTVHKDRLILDYCHYDDEVMGYLNKFDITSGDLICSGAMTPFAQDDRAAEVLHKAKAGVPYEASINFAGGPLVIEEVSAGAAAQVNGYTFEGPGLIIRKWPLRGVAVCPYGADMNTKSEFSGGERVAVERVSVQEGKTMAQEKPMDTSPVAEASAVKPPAQAVDATALKVEPGKAALAEGQVPAVEPEKAAQASTPPAPAATPDPKAELKRFMQTFGDARGAKWYAEGKTFAEAQQLCLAAVRAENEALQKRLTAAGVDLGEKKPVTFTPADDDPQRARIAELKNRGFSEGRARFMAGIVIPKAPAAQ